jgi:hypothetical protein
VVQPVAPGAPDSDVRRPVVPTAISHQPGLDPERTRTAPPTHRTSPAQVNTPDAVPVGVCPRVAAPS